MEQREATATPINKFYFDDTLLNTPKPQASSTVEKKIKKFQQMALKTVPEKVDNESVTSSQSSLGIFNIDQVDDFDMDAKENVDPEDSKVVMPQPSESITERLLLQRKLANQIFEKSKPQNKTGLPLYLLKADPKRNSTLCTSVAKTESTVNASDLEKMSGEEKMSFDFNQISARSSSFGNNSKGIDLTVPSQNLNEDDDNLSEYNLKCNAIFDKIRESDMALHILYDNTDELIKTYDIPSIEINSLPNSALSTDSWNVEPEDSLILKLQKELFVPGELAKGKFEDDEVLWRKEQDTIPANNSKNRLELSCFSGIIGDVDVSLGSKINEKIPVGDFFQRKTEGVEALELKSSPEKVYKPVPLLNTTESTCDSPRTQAPSEGPASLDQSKVDPKLSISSVISVSQIERAIENMKPGETPSRIMSLLMNHKKQGTTYNIPPVLRDSSNFKKSTPKKTSPVVDTEKSFVPVVERTETPKSRRSASPSVRKSMPNQMPVETYVISDDDTDWKDAKKNDASETIKTVTDSPSITCSELNFSEDDFTDQNPEEWVKIDERLESITTCTHIPKEIDISIQLLTKKWLVFKLKSWDIKPTTPNLIKINLPKVEQLLKYKEKQKIPIQFVTYSPGRYEVTLIIELIDMVTKNQKDIEHTIIIDSENPKISTSTDKLDFDIIPEESHKSLEFSIENLTKMEIPIILEIKQKHSIFSLEIEDPPDGSKANFITKSNLILPVGDEIVLSLDMDVPLLQDLNVTSQVEEFFGKMFIYLMSEDLKILKEVKLIGKVGKTKIQFKTNCVPMRLYPGQTKSLHMKNAGAVSLQLHCSVFDKSKKTTDDTFSLQPTKLTIKPNQSTAIEVKFNIDNITKPIYRDICLVHMNGPKFSCPLEGLPQTLSPKLKASPRSKISNLRIQSSASSYNKISPKSSRSVSPHSASPKSTASSDSYFINGKLPIETNRSELVWSCVKPGKTQFQEFVIRNKVSQRIRFYTSVIGDGYKIVKDQNEMVSQLPIMLHGNESKTIIIAFSPNSIQGYYTKLSFTPIECHDSSIEKPQRILMYGYGGYSVIEIQRVTKTSTEKMLLSLGQVNYQSHLEQSFILRNIGNVQSFAQINIIWKQLYRFMDSSLKISPKEVVLKPNEEVEVFVQFKPLQEDFKFLQSKASEVLEVASLQVISGPEITRGRIRRLYNKTNSVSSASYELLSKLCIQFPNENMPSDLSIFKEQVVEGALKDLLQGLTTREITLTIEQNLESSLIGLAQNDDDSFMFHSLCNQTAHLTLESSHMDQVRRSSGGFCTIEPTSIVLIYPAQAQHVVLLQSKHSRPMPFEIALESSELQVKPNIGIIPPGEEAVITISCTHIPSKNAQFAKVMVFVENQVLEISVKILKTKQVPLVE